MAPFGKPGGEKLPDLEQASNKQQRHAVLSGKCTGGRLVFLIHAVMTYVLTLSLIPSLSLLVLLLPLAASPAGQISVVIPHYIRTANTHRVVSALVHMFIVGQVLVACGHPSYPYASTHPKVQVLDDTEGNTKLYTMRRFQAALQAEHDMILHLDDDIIPTNPSPGGWCCHPMRSCCSCTGGCGLVG